MTCFMLLHYLQILCSGVDEDDAGVGDVPKGSVPGPVVGHRSVWTNSGNSAEAFSPVVLLLTV